MQIIEQYRQDFESYRLQHSFLQPPEELYAPIDYIMGMGGKRLRPVMALMAAGLFSDDYRQALPIAMAVEVFHNFSLVHDDIMDEAPLRRGRETVHHKFGPNAGILSGDAMLIYAYRFLEQAGEPATAGRLLVTFNQIAIEVCEGQQYDMNFESRQDVAIPEYLKMIELKTAALISGSLQMGAIVTGASQDDVARLDGFGRHIGIAFQLQDDILDTFGDPTKFGKKVGGDIIQNKKTFLILKALEMAQGEVRQRLRRLMSTSPEDEAAKIAEVTDILNRLEVLQQAEALKATYQEKAFALLEAVNAPEEKKIPIEKLAMALMHRES